jgi:hypothetical protein
MSGAKDIVQTELLEFSKTHRNSILMKKNVMLSGQIAPLMQHRNASMQAYLFSPMTKKMDLRFLQTIIELQPWGKGVSYCV